MGLKLIQNIDSSGTATISNTDNNVVNSKLQASLASRLANEPTYLGGVASTIIYSLKKIQDINLIQLFL